MSWRLLFTISILCLAQTACKPAARPTGPVEKKVDTGPGFKVAPLTAKRFGEVTEDENAGDPEEILRNMCKFYSELRDFEAKLSQFIQWEGSTDPEDVTTVMVRAQRDNYLAIIGSSSVNFVCNGDRRYLYSPELERYSIGPAPNSLHQLATDSELRLTMGNKRPFILALLMDDAFGALMHDVINTKYVGLTKVDGEPCHRIRLTVGEETVELYIQVEGEPLLWKVAITEGFSTAKPVSTRSSSIKGRPIKGAAKAPTVVRRIRNELYREWRTNASQPVFAAFPIAPPNEATKVSSLAWEVRPAGTRPSPMVGRMAPPLELPMADGSKLKLADHRGKSIVMLNFWSSTRKACAWMMPHLADLVAEFREDNVELVTVNYREDPEAIQLFLSRNAVDVPVAIDETGRAAQLFQARDLPTTVLIDIQGQVRSVHTSTSPVVLEHLRAELRALVEEKLLDLETLEQITPSAPVADLVAHLSTPDMRVRGKAVEALAVKGAEAVPRLIESLQSRDTGMKFWAAAALEKIGEPALPAADQLMKLLEDRDPGVRLASAKALGRMGRPILPVLVDKLSNSQKPMVRAYSAYALGNAVDLGAEAATPLFAAIRDRDYRVRMAATNAFSLLGVAGIPTLMQALEDDFEPTHTAASNALARIGEPAVPELVKCLSSPKTHVRYMACITLRDIGPDATSALPELKKVFTSDPEEDVRSYAQKAIHTIETAVPLPKPAKPPEKAAEKTPEKAAEKASEKASETPPEKAGEKAAEPAKSAPQ